MPMSKIVVDPDTITINELEDVIKHLRDLRSRKTALRNHYDAFVALLSNTREDHMSFYSKETGEILNIEDWGLYDELNHCMYNEVR